MWKYQIHVKNTHAHHDNNSIVVVVFVRQPVVLLYVAPSTFLQRNRRFGLGASPRPYALKNGPPFHPDVIVRHSVASKKVFEYMFFILIASSLVSSSHEKFVKENRWVFLGGAGELSLCMAVVV